MTRAAPSTELVLPPPPVRPAERLIWPLLVGALVGSIGAGVALFDPDEARFARTSLEMLRAGDWVVPRFEGEPRLVKPPLLHWLQAGAFAVFGPLERAARLPALLATLVTAGLIGRVGRARFGGAGGAWGAWIWLTALVPFAVARLGTLDMLLTALVTALFALELLPGDRRGRAALAGAAAGLAFLVKGPVGPALALVGWLAGRAAAGRSLRVRWTAALTTLAAFAVAVGPWAFAFWQRLGGETLLSLWRQEVVARSLAGTDHVESPLYYLLNGLPTMLPWAGLLAVGVVRALAPGGRARAGTTARFAAAALVAGVVFLSFSQGKRITYALPLLPLATWVITAELGSLLKRERASARLWALTGVDLALGGALLLVTFAHEAPAERGVALAAGLAFLGAGILPVLRPARARAFTAAVGTVAASLVLQLGVANVVAPRLAERRSSLALIEACPELRRADAVVVVEMRVPSLIWYLDRVPERVMRGELPARAAAADRPLWVFDVDDRVGDLAEATLNWEERARRGKYVVLQEPTAGP